MLEPTEWASDPMTFIPAAGRAPMLSVRDLEVVYGRGRKRVHALQGVSFDVTEGRVVGVVGESGSGKSTLARTIAGLVSPSSGTVAIDGVTHLSREKLSTRQRAHQVQMIFQDPFSSLNPAITVGESILEGVRIGTTDSRSAQREELLRLLSLVRLPAEVAGQRPRQLSGGMRQRIGIARALAAKPRLIVADEITAALDASVQGSILNLLRGLRAETQMTVVFISHNFAAVRYIADEVIVMERGQVVEAGEVNAVISNPQHPYTKTLVDAVPSLSSRANTERKLA